MSRFFTLLLAASCLTAVGQVTYPYNPDGNADALIGATDLQDMLSTYGGAFLPSEILVGDSTLSFWVDQLSETVLTQQATIDSLVELQPKEYIITVADGLDGDWVTIASVGDDSTTPFKLRADADFEFTHNMGSSHQKIKVRASHLFGYGHTLDLHRISYSDSQAMIVAFRIAHGNTYDGAVLQMKVRQNSWGYNSIKLRVTNNNNDSGWHIHPDILQGQSLSADNSPIGYVDHPSASDAPYIEFYPSIDGEDCLGYDTAEGDVILNSNLVVNGMNITEIISSLQNNIDLLTTQLEQEQSNVWYQSWHPSVRGTVETAADQQLLTYYHGFIAPKTGMLTHMKLRVRNSFGLPGATLIRAGVYKSDVNASIPKPIGLLTEGQIFTTVTEHQIIDVAFDLPVEVEKGNVYFAALQQDSPFGGWNFYGSDASGAGNLAWKEISPSGSFLPLVSEGDIIQDGQATFWFIVD